MSKDPLTEALWRARKIEALRHKAWTIRGLASQMFGDTTKMIDEAKALEAQADRLEKRR